MHVFSLSKLTGHAGSRFGWALVRNATVARAMEGFLAGSTLGVSTDSQLRLLSVIRTLNAQQMAGAMKDSGPPKGYKGVHMPEHSFHSDNPGVEECWPRIKCMLCKCSRSLCVFFQA